MRATAINILDMIENSGLEMTMAVISGFSTRKTKDSESHNPDIENFLKKNAIQFSLEKKSINPNYS